MHRALTILLSLLLPILSYAGPGVSRVSGVVTDASSGEKLIGVVLSLGDDYLWASSDSDGNFTFENVQTGTYFLYATCLGYVDFSL